MFIQRILFWAAFCCLSLSLAAPGFAAASQPAEAARVIAVTPGAFVQRGNARTPLKLKDPLYKEDQVSTDATGKLQLLFADDTTVAVAPDSMVNIADFSFGGPAKASFALGVGRGLARVVTGKVVERNREGFKVTTPHATVGIRGTILTADVRSPSQSKFILSQLGTGHTVSVFNTATGQHTEMPKAGLTTEAGATGNVLRPATPAEMNTVQTVTRQTRQAPQPAAANNGGNNGAAQGGATAPATASASPAQAQSPTVAESPTAAAATENPASMGAGGVEDPSGGHSVAGKGDAMANQVAATAPKSNDNALQEAVTGGLSDGLAPGGDLTPGAGDNPGALKASYMGNLNSSNASGTFGFDLNLGSGVLDNGTMDVTHRNDSSKYHGVNGTGQVDSSSNFTLGFDHMATTDPLACDNVTGSISGTMTGGNAQTGPEQVIVNNWEVNTGQTGINIGASSLDGDPNVGSGNRVQ